MSKSIKVFLALCAIACLLVAVIPGFQPLFSGKEEPVRTNLISPSPSPDQEQQISQEDPTPNPENLWDMAYYFKAPLDILFAKNCAVDVDESAMTVTYSVWFDDLDAYDLDAALTDYKALESWGIITDSLRLRAEEIQTEFNNVGREDVTVLFHLVDSYDFEDLFASATAEALDYDIVEEMQPGQKVSSTLYGDNAAYVRAPQTLGEENALKSAMSYLSFSSFSRSGLISQLEFEGFTHSEAVYAADSCGANWDEQAAKSAASYLQISSFSRQGLIDQLEFEGFTYEQALYGVVKNGY